MLFPSLIFAFLLSPAFARAEDLRWEDCVERARAANPELLSAEGNLRASEYSVKAARNGFLPQVSGNMSYGRNGVTGPLGATQENYNASVSAKENLFSGFADQARVDQARAQRELNHASLREMRAKVSSDLRNAFAQMVLAQKNEELSAQILRRRQDNLALVELRFRNGSENKGSVLVSRANFQQAELDVAAARNTLVVARAALARVIGQDEQNLTVVGEVPTLPPVEAVEVDALAREAPAYQKSVADEKKADAGVVLARANFFPSLEVTGSRSRGGPNGFQGTSQWAVGATLSIPLFNGGRDYYGTKSAVEGRQVAQLAVENSLRENKAKLQQAYSSLRETVQRVKVNESYAEAAEVRSVIARQKYNNGLLSFEDWDVIENDLISRQKNLIQSRRDRVSAEGAWELARGQGVL